MSKPKAATFDVPVQVPAPTVDERKAGASALAFRTVAPSCDMQALIRAAA